MMNAPFFFLALFNHWDDVLCLELFIQEQPTLLCPLGIEQYFVALCCLNLDGLGAGIPAFLVFAVQKPLLADLVDDSHLMQQEVHGTPAHAVILGYGGNAHQ